ncbi:MAG: 30S ribosomal protein S17 [Pyrinomonadaceae bacterium]
MATKKKTEEANEAVEETAETGAEVKVAEVEAKEEAPKEKPLKKADTAKKSTAKAKSSDNSSDENSGTKTSKRAERVGIVWSDKMTNTVVVRVDRLVKHPLYHKYIKRRKKFMAHDELGAASGDRVRIVETRPLSARKRWRVVEIIQKAEK